MESAVEALIYTYTEAPTGHSQALPCLWLLQNLVECSCGVNKKLIPLFILISDPCQTSEALKNVLIPFLIYQEQLPSPGLAHVQSHSVSTQ